MALVFLCTFVCNLLFRPGNICSKVIFSSYGKTMHVEKDEILFLNEICHHLQQK